MTIDVNLRRFDEDFFENLEDIMEDSMVQMFIIHPRERSEVEEAKAIAAEYESIFYSVPQSLHGEADGNCVAFSIHTADDVLISPDTEKAVFVDESFLDESIVNALSGRRGVILNATRAYPALEGFHLAIGAENVGAFDTETLAALSMDKIVLQSTYPDRGFEEIADAVKTISDAMFRPEQSIIARATKSSLELAGFR